MTLPKQGLDREALFSQMRERKTQAGIADIPELTVVGEPIMSVFAFTAAEGSGVDPFAVADAFLSDLRDAVKNHGPSQGKEARYS